MRKIVMLAAMLIAPGMAALPAEAGDRGPGFRHSPPHIGAMPHVSRHGKWFHGGHFGQHRHVRPRHFGHSGGVVLFKFHSGDFGFRHRVLPPVRPHHFHRPHHRPPVLTFARPPHFKPWGFSQRHHKSWRGRSHRHR